MEKNSKPHKSGDPKKTSKDEKRKPNPRLELHKLFTDGLKDIYWAEKALTKAISKMIKKTTSGELASTLEQHLKITSQQVARIEQIFTIIEEKVKAKKSEAMEGLIKEAEEIMKSTEAGSVRDAGIISAGKKAEHYEIASYSSLCAFAKMMGRDDVVSLLEQTLNEEKEADEKLTEIFQLITKEIEPEPELEAETILASDEVA